MEASIVVEPVPSIVLGLLLLLLFFNGYLKLYYLTENFLILVMTFLLLFLINNYEIILWEPHLTNIFVFKFKFLEILFKKINVKKNNNCLNYLHFKELLISFFTFKNIYLS